MPSTASESPPSAASDTPDAAPAAAVSPPAPVDAVLPREDSPVAEPVDQTPDDQAVPAAQAVAWPAPPSRTDIVAGLIGAEAGAAIGLLVFGGTPLLPIGVTLGFAVAGPVVLRASRPVRLRLYRHWLRAQLHTHPQA